MKASHFYEGRPDHTFWRRAVAGVEPRAVDPVVSFPFRLSPEDKIATAGSCFAQHIARNLKTSGYNYFVVEKGHPLGADVPDLENSFSYGVFSARYGNIYTARQLRQLFDRAFGNFTPEEQDWSTSEGRWFDPFRPNIQPDGFASQKELIVNRAQHLAAVRRMFEELDVFVFTLGLTEAWSAREDGAILPICPGVIAGNYDEIRYEFVNFSVSEVVEDLTTFSKGLFQINPSARIILTVSPVPLVATAEDRHVLQSTILSKSVLRVACDLLTEGSDKIAYFPSYETVMNPAAKFANFAADLRTVTEPAVQQVMDLFLKHATTKGRMTPCPEKSTKAEYFYTSVSEIVELICDEQLLDQPK